jgi:cobalt-zinc-cadmium efflux system protein
MPNLHDHTHRGTKNYNRYFFIGIFLNTTIVLIEVVIGLLTNSLALIADAGHNLTDVFSLILAWSAHFLSLQIPTERRTYGLKKTTILASLLSSILLFVALGGILWETLQRLTNPIPIEGIPVVIVASIGVIINGFTAYLFAAGQKEDLNIRGAYLHMLADAGISFSVVLGGICLWLFHWNWVDPMITIGIAIAIFIGTWGMLRDSLGLTLDFVPSETDMVGIRSYFLGLDNVLEIHDLHVWGISTHETALTVHIVLNQMDLDDQLLYKIQKYLHDKHQIEHSTIQLEFKNSHTDYDPKCN